MKPTHPHHQGRLFQALFSFPQVAKEYLEYAAPKGLDGEIPLSHNFQLLPGVSYLDPDGSMDAYLADIVYQCGGGEHERVKIAFLYQFEEPEPRIMNWAIWAYLRNAVQVQHDALLLEARAQGLSEPVGSVDLILPFIIRNLPEGKNLSQVRAGSMN